MKSYHAHDSWLLNVCQVHNMNVARSDTDNGNWCQRTGTERRHLETSTIIIVLRSLFCMAIGFWTITHFRLTRSDWLLIGNQYTITRLADYTLNCFHASFGMSITVAKCLLTIIVKHCVTSEDSKKSRLNFLTRLLCRHFMLAKVRQRSAAARWWSILAANSALQKLLQDWKRCHLVTFFLVLPSLEIQAIQSSSLHFNPSQKWQRFWNHKT